MQTAVFRHASSDTVVVVGGNRVPLSQSVTMVTVAENQDWYVRGTPFTVTVTPQYRAEFLAYGTPTTMTSDQLAFIGTINGVPVYATKADVMDIQQELDEALRARNRDLAAVLREQQDLREEFDEIKALYVPLRATGCVFTTLQRQEPTRKGGKDGALPQK
jgi:hypothetical protein